MVRQKITIDRGILEYNSQGLSRPLIETIERLARAKANSYAPGIRFEISFTDFSVLETLAEHTAPVGGR